ncbi:hypothetical protein P8605_04110 [Streptomyces sp. T-3]|nr:hypothetical protein [Streptomyces sp. T-3]
MTFEIYCATTLPQTLKKCGLVTDEATRVADDVFHRGQAISALPPEYFDVLITPFLEEVTGNQPIGSPAWVRAAVAVAVRNSELETFHSANRVSNRFIAEITTAAVQPMQAILDGPSVTVQENPFTGLDSRYPRAWACLSALSDLISKGSGSVEYDAPEGLPVPDLPSEFERLEVRLGGAVGPARKAITSGISPYFDQQIMSSMTMASAKMIDVTAVSALSRYSRNSHKQFRVLEYFLAHRVPVLTSNHLLADGWVSVRSRPWVQPNSGDPRRAYRKLKGLVGEHKKISADVAKQFG